MITLCERLAGQDANVTTVPVSILRFTRQLTRFFEWTNDVADRLAFSEVINYHASVNYKPCCIKQDGYLLHHLLLSTLVLFKCYKNFSEQFFK